MASDPTTPCVVCPHVRRDHVMHGGSVKDWRGDYCTVCEQWCRDA